MEAQPGEESFRYSEARRKVDIITSQSRKSKANLVNNGSPTRGGKLQGELKLSLRKMTIKQIVATTAVRRDTMHKIAGTRERKATKMSQPRRARNRRLKKAATMKKHGMLKQQLQ